MSKKDVNKSSLTYANEIYISEKDLSSPMCQKIVSIAVKEGVMSANYTVEDVLYNIWGLNYKLGYDQDDVNHITRFGEKHKGIRYTGYERCDSEWIKHPMCSKEMSKLYENLVSKDNWERW